MNVWTQVRLGRPVEYSPDGLRRSRKVEHPIRLARVGGADGSSAQASRGSRWGLNETQDNLWRCRRAFGNHNSKNMIHSPSLHTVVGSLRVSAIALAASLYGSWGLAQSAPSSGERASGNPGPSNKPSVESQSPSKATAPAGEASTEPKVAPAGVPAKAPPTPAEAAGSAGGKERAVGGGEAGASSATTTPAQAALEAKVDALEKQVQELQEKSATQGDTEALRDVEEEHILRSVGSTSSISPYTINGNQHLVNLSSWAAIGYTGTLGNRQTTTRSFRVTAVSVTLSGMLRNNPGTEWDVKYNIGVLGSPMRYDAAAISSQATATATAASLNSSAANGFYLNASDVWASVDIKTTKLELEPLATLSIQAGQFLIPYGIDPVSTENNRPTINQAQYVSRLGFSRDIGAVATGGLIHRNDPSATTVPLISYTLGGFNGAGPNSFDTNTGLDLFARIAINPFYQFADNFRNLSVGGNIYEGNVGSSTGDLPTKRRFGVDLSWLRKPFLLTGEYVRTKDGYDGRKVPVGTTGPAPSAAFAESESFVGTLFWTPQTLPDFQPWIRFDRFQPTAFSDLTPADLAAANAGGTGNFARNAYSAGLNWFIWQVEPVTRRTYATSATSRVLKVQASYTRYDQEAFTGAKNQVDVLVIGTL